MFSIFFFSRFFSFFFPDEIGFFALKYSSEPTPRSWGNFKNLTLDLVGAPGEKIENYNLPNDHCLLVFTKEKRFLWKPEGVKEEDKKYFLEMGEAMLAGFHGV